jgi:putative peptidoglycan lipid II flippase
VPIKAATPNELIRSAGTVGLATSVSRVFGYARDASLALVLGAGFSMDAFTVAFRLANLFRRLVAEGAMSAAFVPIFISYQVQKNKAELWEFARKFFYTVLAISGVIVVLEIVLAPVIVRLMAPGFLSHPAKLNLTIYLTRLMAPYLMCVSVAALFMGILNSMNHFKIPAVSPIFFNVSVIVSAFTVSNWTKDPAIGIAFGVLLGGILQFAAQLPVVRSKGFPFRLARPFDHPALKKVGKLWTPGLFGIAVVQLSLFVDSLMASFLSEGSVAQLYYADRVMELVLGVFVISFATVILPDMSKSAQVKDIEEVKRKIIFSFRVVGFVAIPATIGLFLLAAPIIHVLFERGSFGPSDTEKTAFALAFYALGLCSFSAMRLIINAFYATEDAKTPAKIAGLVLVLNVVLNWLLMHPLKQGGIALATSLSSSVGLILLVLAFQKKHGKMEWTSLQTMFLKTGMSATVMGVLCLVFLDWCGFDRDMSSGWKVLALFAAIAGGVCVYLLSSIVLKAEDIHLLKAFKIGKNKAEDAG